MKPSQNNAWKKIQGWCTDIEADYLYRLASELGKDDICIDIGTYQGRSAIALALGCRLSGARVVTVDHYQGNPEHNHRPSKHQVEINLKMLGVRNLVTVVDADAIEFPKQLRKYVHLIFLDSQHDFNCVLDTFVAWWPRLASRGHILFHDSASTGWDQVVSAVDTIAERWPLEYVATADSIRHYRRTH